MSDPQSWGIGNKQERRRSLRFSCELGLTIEWGAAALHGKVVEISSEGMFVNLEDPLWVGARFGAQLALDQPIKLDCLVRRVQPLRGMALTYSVADEAERLVVVSFLEKLIGR